MSLRREGIRPTKKRVEHIKAHLDELAEIVVEHLTRQIGARTELATVLALVMESIIERNAQINLTFKL